MNITKQQIKKIVKEEMMKEMGKLPKKPKPNPNAELVKLANVVGNKYSVEKGPDGQFVVRFYSLDTGNEVTVPMEEVISGFRTLVFMRDNDLRNRRY